MLLERRVLYLLGGVLAGALLFSLYSSHSAASPIEASRYFEGGKIDINASKKLWTSRIAAVGPQSAYAELLQSAQSISVSEGHSFAHAFGAALFEALGTDALSVCDSQLFWGCFHAFVGEAVAQKGIAVAPELKKSCPAGGSELTGCEHGLGHGILGYYGYGLRDLKAALGQCDSLEPEHPRNGCAEGVFMEYSIRELAASSSDIADPRVLSESNRYTPCTQVDAKYAGACGFELVPWWGAAQHRYRALGDIYAWMGAQCAAAPGAQLRQGCLQGLGFNAGLSGTFDEALALCNAAAPSGPASMVCRSALAISTPAPLESLKERCRATGLSGVSLDYCYQYAATDKRVRDAIPYPI